MERGVVGVRSGSWRDEGEINGRIFYLLWMDGMHRRASLRRSGSAVVVAWSWKDILVATRLRTVGFSAMGGWEVRGGCMLWNLNTERNSYSQPPTLVRNLYVCSTVRDPLLALVCTVAGRERMAGATWACHFVVSVAQLCMGRATRPSNFGEHSVETALISR
jgi:hypothetical protein